jgi:hypothetical protein
MPYLAEHPHTFNQGRWIQSKAWLHPFPLHHSPTSSEQQHSATCERGNPYSSTFSDTKSQSNASSGFDSSFIFYLSVCDLAASL